jgi:hypothetical protein
MYYLFGNIQGSLASVYLVNMDLDGTYYLDVGVRIVHMLYIAFGGESLHHHTPSIPLATLEYENSDHLRKWPVWSCTRIFDLKTCYGMWRISE